jgi:hypothetical protein
MDKDSPQFEIKWLTAGLFNEYNLHTHDTSGVFGNGSPLDILTGKERITSNHWDFLLILDKRGKPRAIVAIQWYSFDFISITPLVHYQVFKNCGLWAIKHIKDILTSLADHFGVVKLSGDKQAQTEMGERFNNIVDLNDVINFID